MHFLALALALSLHVLTRTKNLIFLCSSLSSSSSSPFQRATMTAINKISVFALVDVQRRLCSQENFHNPSIFFLGIVRLLTIYACFQQKKKRPNKKHWQAASLFSRNSTNLRNHAFRIDETIFDEHRSLFRFLLSRVLDYDEESFTPTDLN